MADASRRRREAIQFFRSGACQRDEARILHADAVVALDKPRNTRIEGAREGVMSDTDRELLVGDGRVEFGGQPILFFGGEGRKKLVDDGVDLLRPDEAPVDAVWREEP